jgi:hypothetical protein
MTSEEIRIVGDSWCAATARDDGALTDALAASLGADVAARWLCDGVDELVGLLATPSTLGARARSLDRMRPPGVPTPRFAVEGVALLSAVRTVCDALPDQVEHAWRRAWHLLAEELAAEQLSPFSSTSS